MKWGDTNYDVGVSAEGPDTRPLSSYMFLLIGADKDGSQFEEGCDTKEEAETMLAEILQDPVVAHWVLYQRIAISQSQPVATASADPK